VSVSTGTHLIGSVRFGFLERFLHLTPVLYPLLCYPFCAAYSYEQYQYGNDQGEQQNDGGRKLENIQYVNCDTCANMGCFQQENQQNNENAVTLEGMVEWVQTMAECQDTEVQWNNLNLYSGFMCNEEGTGVELAIFLDDECSVYSSQHSFSSVVQYDMYASSSQSVVTYPFVNDINCAEDVTWASPEEMYNNDGNNNNQDNNGEQPEPNEFCQELVQGEMVTPLDYCSYGNDGANNNNNGNNNNQNYQNQYFSGYDYDLTDEQSEQPYYVCTALNKLQSEDSVYRSNNWKTSAKKKNAYKTEGSGQMYDYSARTGSKSSGAEGGKIAGIIIGVIVAFALAMVAMKHFNKKKDDRKEPLVSGDLA